MDSTFTGISAFDVDRTLFSCTTSERFLRFLYRRGVCGLVDIFHVLRLRVLYKCRRLSLENLHRKAFDLFLKGKDQQYILRLSAEFLAIELKNYVYKPAFQALEKARKEGHFILLLTAGSDFLTDHIAYFFGVDSWVSSEYSVDHSGRFAEITRLCEGEDKAAFLKKYADDLGISMENTAAYTDSIVDLPFLEAAEVAVAVQPDRRLKQLAKDRGWRVL